MRNNRLIYEKSPYLLKHSTNPINWYPWSKEAFEEAKRKNRPIFLSIGYFTCHWCHVMEKESFEDQEIAEILNNNFVSIKVDREEMVEIDNFYMTSCQLLNRTGGWPLTIIMTPDKKPFFAATYLPKKSTPFHFGLLDILKKIKTFWKEKKLDLITYSDEITKNIKKILTLSPKSSNSSLDDLIKQAYMMLKEQYDHEYGGFRDAPKFLLPQHYIFLLQYYKKTEDENAINIIKKSLTKMRLGGVYDHIGYGFHRYSTDKMWLLPHFEKMLYDQAMMAICYLKTYEITLDNFYKEVAEEIFEFVISNMMNSEYAFYSAVDADSEGEEGKYYLWTVEEIKEIFKQDSDLFIKIFNLKTDGNFLDEATKKKTGKNILYMRDGYNEIASKLNISAHELKHKIEYFRSKIKEIRDTRIPPSIDDKIITELNGMMIATLSLGSLILKKEEYLHIAQKTYNFIMNHLLKENGSLYRRYRDNEAKYYGNLDDYSFFIWGVLNLYNVTKDEKLLFKAKSFTDYVIKNFLDKEKGILYFVDNNYPDTFFHGQVSIIDGAYPSGHSIMVHNLYKIGEYTSNENYAKTADYILNSVLSEVEKAPILYTMLLSIN